MNEKEFYSTDLPIEFTPDMRKLNALSFATNKRLNKQMQPILEQLNERLNKQMQPILEQLNERLNKQMQPILEQLNERLNKQMQPALERCREANSKYALMIKDMKNLSDIPILNSRHFHTKCCENYKILEAEDHEEKSVYEYRDRDTFPMYG